MCLLFYDRIENNLCKCRPVYVADLCDRIYGCDVSDLYDLETGIERRSVYRGNGNDDRGDRLGKFFILRMAVSFSGKSEFTCGGICTQSV